MATISSKGEMDLPLSFGEWIKCRRRELDLTQGELARRVSCTVFTIRKIEAGTRRPSKQLVGLLIRSLDIPTEEQKIFMKVARGELNPARLNSPAALPAAGHSIDAVPTPFPVNLPFQPAPLVGRETELAALGKELAEPHCRLLTITGLGGIGKTRLAIELASQQQTSFPGGVYYVPLASLNSPEFILPAIAEALGLSFSGASDPQEQLINQLSARAGQALLLVLDNLEHLLCYTFEQDGKDEAALLLSTLLQRLPNLKIVATSRERSNLREEWIFELHGLPVPANDQTSKLENYSAVTLFLQCARQLKADFEVLPEERLSLARVCQLVEGTPLAIELAAAWVDMLSLEEIVHEIDSNMDFLSNPLRNVPERHRSLRAVFDHSWKLLTYEERHVLCRLAVFQGGFLRPAAERVAGASLPILKSLLSKSLLQRRENWRYDLHALIREFALEKLQDFGYLEETRQQHLAYFGSLAEEARKVLRSEQLAEWLNRIEQEHNNIRAALEWAFSEAASSERVEKGLELVASIDRFWPARGHIREGINWLRRGLQANNTASLARAKALRTAGWLYNHGEDKQTAILLLQESVAISRQLNEEICQANALDTLGDVACRFGDFAESRDYYAESLEIYRRRGDPLSIGFSLASAGRLYVDYGYLLEAEQLLMEGLPLLMSASDLRGRAYCINSLGRLALFKGDIKLAASRFRQSLHLNYELGYIVDITECLCELAVVDAIAGDERTATRLWSAAAAIQKKIGVTFPVNDPIYRQAPPSWLESAPTTEEWAKGEKLSTDQAVADALESGP
jgi:predicted ATPase/DNA-binding XRE family transcriptional regulator